MCYGHDRVVGRLTYASLSFCLPSGWDILGLWEPWTVEMLSLAPPSWFCGFLVVVCVFFIWAQNGLCAHYRPLLPRCRTDGCAALLEMFQVSILEYIYTVYRILLNQGEIQHEMFIWSMSGCFRALITSHALKFYINWEQFYHLNPSVRGHHSVENEWWRYRGSDER